MPPCRRPRATASLSRAGCNSPLGLRLTLSLIAGGCLILATALQFLVPSQRDVAELVAGVAALLVAVPALVGQPGSRCAIRTCTASRTNSSRSR